jgi:hypothetical protein
MKDTEVKKGLIVSVILLFIGVAVAPSINLSVVKASQDKDLLEVTTQACGIQGYKDTTVKLTREQYQNLESYLVEFRARLNQTSTREEAVPIFKEAVVELDKYGLLPREMSVEKAQQLMLCDSQNEKKIPLINNFFNKFSLFSDGKSNALCLIAGQSSNTFFIPFVSRADIIPLIITLSSSELFATSGYSVISKVLFGLSILFGIIFVVSLLWGNITPLSFLHWICFGEIQSRPNFHIEPAYGWLSTIGLNGVKTWNQSFTGGIGYPLINAGIIDFTGIKLLLFGKYTYIGSALFVKID